MTKRLQNYKYALIYYRKPIVIAMILTVLLISVFAFCGSWQDATGFTKTTINKVDEVFSMDSVADVAQNVSVTFGDDVLTVGKYSATLGVLTSVTDIMTGIAFCFCLITFFVSFANLRDFEMTGQKLFVKIGLWIVCIALVFKAPDICYAIANVGTGLALKISALATESTISADTQAQIDAVKQLIYDQCVPEDDGILAGFQEFFASLGVYIELIIPAFAMWIVKMITNVVCFSRAIEITLLSLMSPFAFADSSELDHFGHGSGSRFFKNVAALALSGSIIIIVMLICNQLSIGVISDAVSGGDVSSMVAGTSSVVFIGFAQGAMILKSQSIAKTIVGIG